MTPAINAATPPIYIAARTNRGVVAERNFTESQSFRAGNFIEEIRAVWDGKFALEGGFGCFDASLSGAGSRRSADHKLKLTTALVSAALNRGRLPAEALTVDLRLLDGKFADRLTVHHGEARLAKVGLVIDRGTLWVGRDHRCIRLAAPGAISKAARAFALEAVRAADNYDATKRGMH